MVDISRLVSGYKAFYQKYFRDDVDLYKNLSSKGQNPRTLVIACSDSRVDPSIILGADPGDIFVIRNVANLVPPYQEDRETYHGTSAALEFAVKNLGVDNIVILGHSNCAGIRALVDIKSNKNNNQHFSFVDEWVKIAKNPVKDFPVSGNEELRCAKESLIVSYHNLQTYPWIAEKINHGKLDILLWYFDISTGELENYNSSAETFELLLPREQKEVKK